MEFFYMQKNGHKENIEKYINLDLWSGLNSFWLLGVPVCVGIFVWLWKRIGNNRHL